MNLNFIPVITAVVPAVAVHVCYLLAAQLGHVPWCFPYIDSCTSISAVGRMSPESHLFRAAIITTGVFMLMYWRLNYEWFKTMNSQMPIRNRSMLCCGIIASMGVILYATVLGSIGQEYHVQRRLGVTTFYVFTFLAQLIMTHQIGDVAKRQPALVSARVYRSLVAICATVSILGLANILSWALYEEYGSIDDAIAWTVTLFILGYFFVTYFAWKQSGFQASFTVTAS